MVYLRINKRVRKLGIITDATQITTENLAISQCPVTKK